VNNIFIHTHTKQNLHQLQRITTCRKKNTTAQVKMQRMGHLLLMKRAVPPLNDGLSAIKTLKLINESAKTEKNLKFYPGS
jgi:hypothetical protein